MSKILILPGDGIGIEIVAQAVKVIDSLNSESFNGYDSCSWPPWRYAAYDETGSPFPDETIRIAKECDSIFARCCWGPQMGVTRKKLEARERFIGHTF